MEYNREKFSFSKAEKLKSQKSIAELYHKGNRVSYGHILAIYLSQKDCSTIQVLTAAAKRLQKKAVDRNYSKRLIREAYRLNSHTLKLMAKNQSIGLTIAFHLIKKEYIEFQAIEKDVRKIIAIIISKVYES